MRKIIQVYGSLLMMGLLLASCASSTEHHREDTDLIASFRQNKEGFEKLLKMYREDRNLSVIGFYNGGEPYIGLSNEDEEGISEERKEAYLNSLKEIEAFNIGPLHTDSNKGYKEGVFFTVSYKGLSYAGNIKRIFWFQNPIEEKEMDVTGMDTVVFKPLEDHWYLVSQYR